MLRLGLGLTLFLFACGGGGGGGVDAGPGTDTGAVVDGAPTPPCNDLPAVCAARWEEGAANKFDTVLTDPAGLMAFLKAVPKGGDLHNHLSGAVYAEQYLSWGSVDGDCVNNSTHAAVASSGCGASAAAMPTSGSFYDAIIDAWSMRDFVAGAENGHDHFFAVFGKYGLVAGAHRDDTLADVAKRAADENEVYVETMFNLASRSGALSATLFSGTMTAADIPTLYTNLTTNAGFAAALATDVGTVNSARSSYRSLLGCSGLNPPAACAVNVRFVAQVARTGAGPQVFGQLVGAFEMAKTTGQIVAADLSSPEDATASINNYNLQMAMLDFLHTKYAGVSPLHVTLHAGELVSQYLPAGSTANTFHIRAAVEMGHAERIGHGIDVMSETDPAGLMDEMAAMNVSVEVCLSSNTQILGVSGTNHPLAQYIAHGVPFSLATDDQGVSRSSMAGEYQRAALDQHLDYRALKKVARTSLEHAFLPGASLWTTLGTAPNAACAPTDTMGIGDQPNTTCAAFLATSERATTQWELERRFLVFESQQ